MAYLANSNGKVMYDYKTNRLFKILEVRADKVLVGSFCTYYEDALRQGLETAIPLSWNYIAHCKTIVTVDTTPELGFDGVWIVRKN